MLSEKNKKSIRYALQSLKGAYSFFGILVAVIASTNFVFSLLHVEPSLILHTLLSCYRAIVHGAMHWILYPFSVELPGAVIDIIFLYALIGGAVGRSYKENVEEFPDKASLVKAFRVLREPERSPEWRSRVNEFFFHAPKSFRIMRRALWWPGYMRDWFSKPMVYTDDYYGYNRWRYLPSNYKSGKKFLFDRRVLFFIQVITITLGFLVVVILNAFLTVPK